MLGHVTSWCRSPSLDAWIALALLAERTRAARPDAVGGVAARRRQGSRAGRPAVLHRCQGRATAWLTRTYFEVGATMAGHYGAAATGVTLAETTFAGAWNVQGDARRPEFVDRGAATLHASRFRSRRTRLRASRRVTALWLGPASWLVVASDERDPRRFRGGARRAQRRRRRACSTSRASRVAWTIAGAARRDHSRQGVSAGLPSARVRRRGLRAERLRTRECALLPARRRRPCSR